MYAVRPEKHAREYRETRVKAAHGNNGHARESR